jgi:hypothetical protein
MVLENHILELVIDKFCRRVIITLYLVTDDIHLMTDFLLRVDTTEHDITEQVDSPVQVVFQNGGIEHGILLIGKSIQVAANTLQAVQNLDRRALPSALNVTCSQK